MDPEEVMKLLRDAMIEVSDLVGTRLVQGGSTLSRAEIETAVDAAAKVVEHGEALLGFLDVGGYIPARS